MSLPLKPNEIQATITLSAAQAENLANRILLALKAGRELQEKDPTMHWSGDILKNPIAGGLLFPIHVGDHIKIQIAPDKRHEGCSGYCHY